MSRSKRNRPAGDWAAQGGSAKQRAFKATACPDCGATFSPAGGMIHEPTCPAGLKADRAQARDEAWFILHPGQDSYERDTTWGERAEAEALGIALPTRVRITELTPGGIRMRQFLYGGDAR